MKLTIIPSDKYIGIGSTGYVGINTDWSWIADNIHAVQWNDTYGEVEYNDGTSNVAITTIGIYEPAIMHHEHETKRINLAQQKIEDDRENNTDWAKVLRKWRNIYLEDSDWIVAKSSEEGVAVPTEWKTYRKALRDIPDGLDFDTLKSMAKAAQSGIGHTGWPTAPGGWTFS